MSNSLRVSKTPIRWMHILTAIDDLEQALGREYFPPHVARALRVLQDFRDEIDQRMGTNHHDYTGD